MIAPSFVAKREREIKCTSTKVNRHFVLCIIVTPNVLYLSVLLVARLVVSAFILRLLEEHLSLLLVPH